MTAANPSLEPTRAFGALWYRQSISAVDVVSEVGSASFGASGSAQCC
jgi:hypothetical protein